MRSLPHFFFFFLFLGQVHSGIVTHKNAIPPFVIESAQTLLCVGQVIGSERKEPGEINTGISDRFVDFIRKTTDAKQCRRRRSDGKLFVQLHRLCVTWSADCVYDYSL